MLGQGDKPRRGHGGDCHRGKPGERVFQKPVQQDCPEKLVNALSEVESDQVGEGIERTYFLIIYSLYLQQRGHW